MYMQKVTLDDKYTLRRGRAFMTAVQALVRLPMVQRWRDEEAGLKTAGFISGYRGSPLGGYDQELTRAGKKYLEAQNIRFVPGLNEDLAATAVWGTQHVGTLGESDYDGVFGIWYGKGPGVDRSMDVLRHANAAGTSPHGGVLAIAGDDHGAKSSTLPHQTEHDFMSAMIPVLYPAGIQEFIEYGLLGIAMSRFAGSWVAFKTTSETAESSGTVDLNREMRKIIRPSFDFPSDGVHLRWPDPWRGQDTRLQRVKPFAAMAFARANEIDRIVWDTPNPRLGIIASGKAYLDVRQALHEMGIDKEKAARIGLRLYKVGMVWPLEPEGTRRFCEGLDEILVVEEKREMIEHQLKWQLYDWKESVRPRVVGKDDGKGSWLLSPDNELNVAMVAEAIAARLAEHYNDADIRAKLDYFVERKRAMSGYLPAIERAPYFCSGCPHNISTKVPEGSRALAGIGCHIMAINMDRHNETFTQMGGEGATWIGQAPFSKEKHVFVNLGDGTYVHSGILAIRAAVAANVNVTYKILYNDAVAMTGGQPAEGGYSVPDIAGQLLAEGVKKVAIASERPNEYNSAEVPRTVKVSDRGDIDRLQREFRDIEGVTAIIYDQTCAAEKRRRRKRGLMEDPDRRVFINEMVCEGCGDCSVQSNCVSVEPLETEFGRKRRINQSTCNKDYSCLNGFCPSFVTIRGGDIRRSKAAETADALPDLPEPDVPELSGEFNVLVTGVGGTGVLTIGALLGMASHLDGKSCSILDMTGLAQKGGAVLSHVRLAPDDANLRSPRIISGGTDLLLACDNVVAASKDALETLSPRRSAAVVNSHLTPVADFVLNKNIDFQQASVERRIADNTNSDRHFAFAATEMATALLGDSIATNVFILGFAWQKGLVPVAYESIAEAIRLNGVAVDANLKSFHWGRIAAHDPEFVVRTVDPDGVAAQLSEPLSLGETIVRREEYLTAYQGKRLAKRYRKLVDRVRQGDARVAVGGESFTEAVVHNYFKLLAYKDEYEVARLYSDGSFREKLERQFDGDYRVTVHLSPPLISRKDPATGRPRKREFGPWVFKLFPILAKFRVLRGTPLDPFGFSAERRMERRLIRDYEELIEELLGRLARHNYTLAVDLASLPDGIRGFGPVKMKTVTEIQNRQSKMLGEFRMRNRDPEAPDTRDVESAA